jgi:Tfp pilus assembly protein PilO
MDKVIRFRVPILTGVGALIMAIIVYAAWISPEGSKLSSLHAREAQLESQQSHLQVELFTLKREKAHVATNCAQLTQDLTAVPGTPSVDAFFQQVTQLAVAAGDPNTPSISVTNAAASADGVKLVTVSMTLQGSYGQMMAFLKGLETFPRLFSVSTITVNGGPVAVGGGAVNPGQGGYNLTLGGNIFYSAGQADVCSGA